MKGMALYWAIAGLIILVLGIISGTVFNMLLGAFYIGLGAYTQSTPKTKSVELSAEKKYQEWLWEPDAPLQLPVPDSTWSEHAIKDFRNAHRDLAFAARSQYAQGKISEEVLESAMQRSFDSETIPTNDPAWVSIFGNPPSEEEVLKRMVTSAFDKPVGYLVSSPRDRYSSRDVGRIFTDAKKMVKCQNYGHSWGSYDSWGSSEPYCIRCGENDLGFG